VKHIVRWIRYREADKSTGPRLFERISLLRREIQSLTFGEKTRAAIAYRGLRHLREALQQPWQHHFQAHVIVSDLDMAGCGLAERADPKEHLVAIPALFIDIQNRYA